MRLIFNIDQFSTVMISNIGCVQFDKQILTLNVKHSEVRALFFVYSSVRLRKSDVWANISCNMLRYSRSSSNIGVYQIPPRAHPPNFASFPD